MGSLAIRPAARQRSGWRSGCCAGARGGTVRAVESPGSFLALRLAAGDDRALAEVFDELGPAVHATALQILGSPVAAQDVVQDVFVELWLRPERFDETLG